MKLTSIVLLLLASMHLHAAEYVIKQKSLNTKSFKAIKGMQVLDSHAAGNLILVDIPEMQVPSVIAEIYADPSVEYVVENFELYAVSAPLTVADMVNLREQWANQKVNLEQAWQIAGNRGSKNVTIAVIDTGVDYRHESLASNMVPGYDFLDKDSDPMDVTSEQNPGHGTHCSGSIGGNGLVDNGIVGAIPVVNIMPLRFLGPTGGGNLMDGIKAIDYAIEKKVDIISASWGAKVSRSTATPLVEAVERADKAGIIFVAAAANNGTNNDSVEFYPANAGFPNTISVAASDINDAKPEWSNYGKKTVHIASPGHKIISTIPNNQYKEFSGTSMATPLVAGIVGLLKAQNPSLTGAEARAILQTTGAKVSIETACNCRVDAAAAMTALKSQQMLLVPSAAALKPQETLQVSVKHGKAPFTYSSSNTAALTVDANGMVTAVADGVAQITVTDASGATLTSLDYVVSSETPGGSCPLGDPMYCELACAIMPQLPFCQ